jgi:hypothetical protein
MVTPLIFRRSDAYKKKLMRIGAAMRRYSEHHLPADQNINSLALEMDSLEELSLSAFSLMKALKKNIEDSKRIGIVGVSRSCVCEILICDRRTCGCICHEKTKELQNKSCIIHNSVPNNDSDDK